MLERGRIAIAVERSTAEPLTEAEAAALLRSVERVLLLRGPALRELDAGSATPADLRGPTGKIRAPLVVVDGTLLAGFRLEALTRLLSGSDTTAGGGRRQPPAPSARSRKAKSKAESRRRS